MPSYGPCIARVVDEGSAVIGVVASCAWTPCGADQLHRARAVAAVRTHLDSGLPAGYSHSRTF